MSGAALGFAVSTAGLLALSLAGIERLDVMLAVLVIGFGFLGLAVPTSSVMALDDHGDIAGAASAMLGTLQMVIGALVMALTSVFADGSARPMVAGIAAAALCALALTRLTLGGSPAVPAATRARAVPDDAV